jgi:predicted secreted Zn-dependent protease
MREYSFDRDSYQKDLKKIYQDILDEKREMQEDYDRETNHSINREKQAEWLKKIEKKLEEFRNYAGYQNRP